MSEAAGEYESQKRKWRSWVSAVPDVQRIHQPAGEKPGGREHPPWTCSRVSPGHTCRTLKAEDLMNSPGPAVLAPGCQWATGQSPKVGAQLWFCREPALGR